MIQLAVAPLSYIFIAFFQGYIRKLVYICCTQSNGPLAMARQPKIAMAIASQITKLRFSKVALRFCCLKQKYPRIFILLLLLLNQKTVFKWYSRHKGRNNGKPIHHAVNNRSPFPTVEDEASQGRQPSHKIRRVTCMMKPVLRKNLLKWSNFQTEF